MTKMIVTMKCVLLFLVLAIGLVVSAGPCDGDLWPDDKGVHINAHGGGVMWHEATGSDMVTTVNYHSSGSL